MTEKDKMMQHMMYDANYDKELLSDRERCKEVCYDYNMLRPTEEEQRAELLRNLFKKTGETFHIESAFWCDYGYNIEIGENFYANHNLVILDAGGVKFGDNVFIAPDCGFHTSGHPIDFERRNQGLEYAYPIVVGDNVWIGAGVQVMPGVTIGSNVVIGGGSVVVKDIPDNSVAVGKPCRVIRQIIDEDNEKVSFSPGSFFHGTKADLRTGDLLKAGFQSNYEENRNAKYVYFAGTLDAAIWGAELASGEGKQRIYVVEPTGEFEDDPNLTDKKFPGNPTKSYRTKEPLKIVAEVTGWIGHSPEILQNMLDNLKKLDEMGIKAIE